MTEEHVPVRLSHLLRDCSVGAIVRGPDSLMVVQDIRTWDRPGSDSMEREIRYVDRVRSALGIEHALCTPPRSAERNGTVIGWVPALRFPTWMRCLSCGLLHPAPWRNRGGAGSGRERSETGSAGGFAHCGTCGGRLEQVPWVLVHEEGYLADVPWHHLAHGHSGATRSSAIAGFDRTESYLRVARRWNRTTDSLHALRFERDACRPACCRGYRSPPALGSSPGFASHRPSPRRPRAG